MNEHYYYYYFLFFLHNLLIKRSDEIFTDFKYFY